MFAILPPEMLLAIFAKVDDKTTLCNLLVTSRQFSHLVEPFLYARIDLPGSTLMLSRILEALETSKWRRASYVKALSVVSFATDAAVPIGKILARTVNLKSLKLDALSSVSFQKYIFYRRPTYSLTTLHLESYYVLHDNGLLDCLESQRSLEALSLPVHSAHFGKNHTFAPTSFPKLKVLFAHVSLAIAFLRTSAPLKHLRVFHPLFQNRDFADVSTDGLRTDSVRTLSCLLRDEAALLASLFPDLEWLSGPLTATGLDALHLHNHKLRGLLLQVPNRSRVSQDDVARLFGTMPALQFIEYTTNDGKHHRWYRDAAAPTLVRWLCDPEKEWLADWVEDVVEVDDSDGCNGLL